MKPKRKPRKKRSVVTKATETQPSQRIQKLLAHAGLGSRREIEQWIKDGKIRINDKIAQLGDKMRPNDILQIKGRMVNLSKRLNVKTRVLLYNKPAGEVVTRRDPEGRPVVFTQLPKMPIGRWIAIGRLDINTLGLLMVTNNGELANRVMHPSMEMKREYAVRVLGKVTDEMLENLHQGVKLEDGMAHFDSLQFAGGEGANSWYRVTVKEGRNRIVRRLWESEGIVVSRLIRVSYGSYRLPEKLKARTFAELAPKEVDALLLSVDLAAEYTSRDDEGKTGPKRRGKGLA